MGMFGKTPENAGIPAAILLAIAYGAFAALSLATTQTEFGIAVFWPSSGVFLAGLMLMQGRTRLVFAGLVAIASMVANLAYGVPWWSAAGFTLANIVEGCIAAVIALTGNRAWGRFDDPIWVLRFFVGATLAALVSATIATASAGEAAGWLFFGSWFTTVLLGLLIVTPAIVVFHRGGYASLVEDDGLFRALAIFAAGSASIAVTFYQTDFPLLYLPLAVTVFATYLLGVTGAIGMVVLVTIGGTIGIMQGRGLGYENDPISSTYFFQFYLLVVFVSALPLATLLEKSRRQAAEIAMRKSWLETAETFAQIGHWRFDLTTERIEWSDEMFRIYGLDPANDELRDFTSGAVIPDQVQFVRAAMKHTMKTGEPFDHKLRIRHEDGSLREVHARGFVEHSGDTPVAIFGVLKDVTDHADAMEELQQARDHAEREAEHALLLSETDPLTGVANRRKLLAVLGKEMDAAAHSARNLAILMIDIDHFKAINDTHGHGVGDVVLQRIAEAGRSCLRDQDVFGRLGGEEFLVILPGADEELAIKVGERLRDIVRQLFADRTLGLDEVTISLGVAVYQAGVDEKLFLRAADLALYRSKAEGRDRLTVGKTVKA